MKTVLQCKTHQVTLVVEGTRRVIYTPQGSWGHMEPCQLIMLPYPQPGKVGDCEIEEVK